VSQPQGEYGLFRVPPHISEYMNRIKVVSDILLSSQVWVIFN